MPAPAVGWCMLGTGRIEVTPDHLGVAAVLVNLLQQAGYQAALSSDQDGGTTAADNASQLIFLGALGASSEDSTAVHTAAFVAAKSLAGRAQTLVTVQDSGGFGLAGIDPSGGWLSGLPGLVKTAALEWPAANVKAVDLAVQSRSAADLAQALFSELTAGGPEREVYLKAAGERFQVQTGVLSALTLAEPAAAQTSAALLPKQPVLIVSGGARGVTGACLEALATELKPRFALFGRSELKPEPPCCHGLTTAAELKQALLAEAKASAAQQPERQQQPLTPASLERHVQQILAQREVAATLAALSAAGCEVLYLPVDIRDEAAVAAAVTQVHQRWGEVHGLIHGAGVLADRLIADKTLAQFDQVFSTKVAGLRALLQATSADPLQMICLFSSVAARYGNPGQCDYAMANEVLNKVAQSEAQRRGAHCLVKAINFGPWDGGMVTPGLKGHFARLGVPLIALGEGARQWVRELTEPAPYPTEVVFTAAAGAGSELVQPLVIHTSVSALSHPELASHVIAQAVVLPVAQVAAWFTMALEAFASTHLPELQLDYLEELVVLRGVQLSGYHSGGDRFALEVSLTSPQPRSRPAGERGEEADVRCTVLLKLPGEAAPRYRACGVFKATATTAVAYCEPLPQGGKGPPSAVYPTILFHGPKLQAIAAIDSLSAEHCVASLHTGASLGWPNCGRGLDVVLLDGVLQLALVHGYTHERRKSLPTKLGQLRWYAQGHDQTVRCLLERRRGDASSVTCDAVLIAADGRICGEVRGIETHFYGDQSPQVVTAPTPPKLTLATGVCG